MIVEVFQIADDDPKLQLGYMCVVNRDQLQHFMRELGREQCHLDFVSGVHAASLSGTNSNANSPLFIRQIVFAKADCQI